MTYKSNILISDVTSVLKDFWLISQVLQISKGGSSPPNKKTVAIKIVIKQQKTAMICSQERSSQQVRKYRNESW